ncbi:MAG: hypothetical protein ACRDJ1_05785, partial [Actinomycetota bacterium]
GKLPGGTFLVGSDATSLSPTPELFGGTVWQKEGCTAIEDNEIDRTHVLPGEGRGWPVTSRDCIYLGGFGIGPTRPAHDIDDGGIWVRSLAISNGQDTTVWQIIDATGYFYSLNPMVCADCGILQMKDKIAADTGVPRDAISIGATHTHAGPDAYGGWGGLPQWYWHQIRDSVIASAKQALAGMETASLTVGEVILRDFNGERRDHYYSTPDYQATWLQARASDDGAVIATLANYAGHPTIVGDPILHADWPGAASRRFQSIYGGVGLLFEGGLGNVSIRGRGGDTDDAQAENTGIAFGSAVASDIAGGGTTLTTNDIAVNMQLITHPVSNPVLAAGGILNLFNRDFLPGEAAGLPGAYQWSKTAQTEPGALRSCVTASPVTIKTPAGAVRVGNALFLFAPGEIFSNISEVAKSKTAGSAMTFVFGQTNDSLGYIIQSFEFDVMSNAVTEYGTQTAEYEEFFSIDRCFGDHVIQTLLDTARELGF